MSVLITGFRGLVGGRLFELQPDCFGLEMSSDEVFITTPRQEILKITPTPNNLKNFLAENGITAVIHLGAITSTLEKDESKFKRWNIDFSNNLLIACVETDTKFIFASSQAVYGHSWNLSEDISLEPPRNLYAKSKYETENFLNEILSSGVKSQTLVALRLSNVYGKNEAHKKLMASTIFQFWAAAMCATPLNIFYTIDKPKGAQSRDFISVDQVAHVINLILSADEPVVGIYNLGSGTAINFLELAEAIIDIAKSPSKIEFIKMPEELIQNYQWLTKANITKLQSRLNWELVGDFKSEIRNIYGGSRNGIN